MGLEEVSATSWITSWAKTPQLLGGSEPANISRRLSVCILFFDITGPQAAPHNFDYHKHCNTNIYDTVAQAAIWHGLTVCIMWKMATLSQPHSHTNLLPLESLPWVCIFVHWGHRCNIGNLNILFRAQIRTIHFHCALWVFVASNLSYWAEIITSNGDRCYVDIGLAVVLTINDDQQYLK